MSRRTRFSLLGLGRAGGFHLESLRLLQSVGTELDCVYDVDLDRASEVAKQYNCRVANDADDATVGTNIDAVIVATPTDSHFDYVIGALEAGKPVLTEKPLGSHLDQIDKCFRTAMQHEVPLFVAFQRRFDATFASLVQGVHDGKIGTLQMVRSTSRDNPVPSPDYIRISGGIYHDCMVHDLDMVCHIAGEVPELVSAFGSSFIPEIGACDDHDNVAASLRFASGVVAMIDVNRKSVYGYDQRLEAFGSGGMLQAENRHPTTTVCADESGFHRPPIEYSFPTRYLEAYREEVRCFLACCRGEASVPITYQDVRNNHLLASGLELSAREHQVIRFDEIEGRL